MSIFTSCVFPSANLTFIRSDRSLMKLDPLTSRMEYGRREASRTSAAQSRFSNAGDRSRGIGRQTRGSCAGSFCADPEVILLSAVAADSAGTAVGSRCWQRNDRKTKREPRTRLGVNLIFYSAARSWCASTSTFELGPRPGPGAAGCMSVVGQRHRAT